MILPFFSIIIPTFNSEKIIKICLKGTFSQKYPKNKYEVIVVDNNSSDKTREIAKDFGAKVILVKGVPPQVCQQRNSGATKAKGEYLMILDHDMEMPEDFLNKAANELITNSRINAWYIPEIVVAGNTLLGKIRTLEKRFYDDTVISAARIIKRSIFDKTDGYDKLLSGGPADWDMDIQLRLAGVEFGTVSEYLYHHEESLTFWKHITKKSIYIEGSNRYKKKWRRKNTKMYHQVVLKQFSPLYRYIFVFIENSKWRKLLLPNLYQFIILYFSKIIVGLIYILNKLKAKIL